MKTNPDDPISLGTVNKATLLDNGETTTTPIHLSGLTKREHFSLLALQGLIANHRTSYGIRREVVTQLAVEYADELINALNKQKKEDEEPPKSEYINQL